MTEDGGTSEGEAGGTSFGPASAAPDSWLTKSPKPPAAPAPPVPESGQGEPPHTPPAGYGPAPLRPAQPGYARRRSAVRPAAPPGYGAAAGRLRRPLHGGQRTRGLAPRDRELPDLPGDTGDHRARARGQGEAQHRGLRRCEDGRGHGDGGADHRLDPSRSRGRGHRGCRAPCTVARQTTFSSTSTVVEVSAEPVPSSSPAPAAPVPTTTSGCTTTSSGCHRRLPGSRACPVDPRLTVEPTITIPAGQVPTALEATDIVGGSGAAVGPDATVTVNYRRGELRRLPGVRFFVVEQRCGDVLPGRGDSRIHQGHRRRRRERHQPDEGWRAANFVPPSVG